MSYSRVPQSSEHIDAADVAAPAPSRTRAPGAGSPHASERHPDHAGLGGQVSFHRLVNRSDHQHQPANVDGRLRRVLDVLQRVVDLRVHVVVGWRVHLHGGQAHTQGGKPRCCQIDGGGCICDWLAVTGRNAQSIMHVILAWKYKQTPIHVTAMHELLNI